MNYNVPSQLVNLAKDKGLNIIATEFNGALVVHFCSKERNSCYVSEFYVTRVTPLKDFGWSYYPKCNMGEILRVGAKVGDLLTALENKPPLKTSDTPIFCHRLYPSVWEQRYIETEEESFY